MQCAKSPASERAPGAHSRPMTAAISGRRSDRPVACSGTSVTNALASRRGAGHRRRLLALADEVVFGKVYARPGLSLEQRALCTIAALTAWGTPSQLRVHVARPSGWASSR